MKYSTRLVTALAVIAFVVVTIVAAFTKLTATATRTVVSTGVLMAGIALTAIVAPTRGGVLFFYTSVLAFAVLLGIAIKRMTKATTRYSFFGATGPGTTDAFVTLKTIQHKGHVVQRRHQATETIHYTVEGHDRDTTKGFLWWLSRKVPSIVDHGHIRQKFA